MPEGRLVASADGLWYARENSRGAGAWLLRSDVMRPPAGSKVGALGSVYAGLFAGAETLVQQLTYAGDNRIGEKMWRYPIVNQTYLMKA